MNCSDAEDYGSYCSRDCEQEVEREREREREDG